MKTKTLYIKTQRAFEEVEMGDIALLFGDNGGDPDGCSWLPYRPIDPEDEPAKSLLEKYPEYFGIAEVTYYNIPDDYSILVEHAKARGALSPEHFLEINDADDDWQALGCMLNSIDVSWAGYLSSVIVVEW